MDTAHQPIPEVYRAPPVGPAPEAEAHISTLEAPGYHRRRVGPNWYDTFCLCRLHRFADGWIWLAGYRGRPFKDTAKDRPQGAILAAGQYAPPPSWAMVAHRQRPIKVTT